MAGKLRELSIRDSEEQKHSLESNIEPFMNKTIMNAVNVEVHTAWSNEVLITYCTYSKHV